MKTNRRRKLLFRLFALELKTALRAMPRLILGTVILCTLMGGIFYCTTAVLYDQKPIPHMTINVISEDTSDYASYAIDFVSSMESTKDLFRFTIVSEKEAFDNLRTGNTAAILKLPSGLMESILDGSNQNVQVILPDAPGLSSLLLEELSKAGAKTLSCAQSGIYTIADLYIDGRMEEYLKDSCDALNQSNLQYALARNRLFAAKSTTAAGEIPPSVYYTAAALLGVFMLLGTVCSSFLSSRPAAFTQKLNACSISGAANLLMKLAAVLAVFLSIAVLLFLFLAALGGPAFRRNILLLPGPASILALFMILLYVSTFTLLIFQVGKTPGNSVLLLFFISILLLFLSGVFVPSAFFPLYIRRLSVFLPTSQAIRQLSAVIMGMPDSMQSGILFSHSLACFLLSLLIRYSRKQAEHCS